MRWLVIVLALFVVASCKKDELFNPTGLYNVTTQVGSSAPKLGSVTINPDGAIYKIYFDPYAGAFGTLDARIENGTITIDTQTKGSATYQGSGRITDEGALIMDFKLINHSQTYKVKVQGNRAK